MGFGAKRLVCVAVIATLAACAEAPEWVNQPPPRMYTAEMMGEGCELPEPTILLYEDGALLEVFSFRLQEVHNSQNLPEDEGLMSYRAAVREAGAAEMQPALQVPTTTSEAEAQVWRDEQFNNELAYTRMLSKFDHITCLDALLFAEQNRRVPQLEQPTEFFASVLRLDGTEGDDVTIVFGAGSDMFPPKSAYGFEVVDEYIANGWTYSYALHNHTLQRNGDAIALGVPVPSTADIQFARGQAALRGLESVRVTNGLFTFSAPIADLSGFRAR